MFLRLSASVPKLLFQLTVVTAVLSVMPLEARAALSLSVNPSEGGTSLRFGRVDLSELSNKEVRIRVNSSEGKQFQVFQRIVEPLVNEQGKNLSFDALSSYTLSGSNTAGTLYQQDMTNLGYGEELLYSSNPNGDSDAFSVVYSAKRDRVNGSGNFLGKIIYTVRPVGAGSQDEVFLTVYLEAPGDLKVEATASSGKNLVRLGLRGLPDQQGNIKFSVTGNTGQELKFFQEVEQFPQDELSDEIAPEDIQFVVSATGGGEAGYQSPTPLERNPVLLYSTGDNDDNFSVNFTLNPESLASRKAGLYRGKIRYTAEGGDVHEVIDLDLELEVSPIFKLDVEYPPGGVHFSGLIPTAAPQEREIKVVVRTNLGKPFIVTQHLSDALTNQKGEKIEEEFFSIKGELLEGKTGRVGFPEFAPVPVKDTPIFFSDGKGSSTEFRMIYRLRPYPEIEAGDYSAAIVYSLGEM